MEITKIPFIEKIGINRNRQGLLGLEIDDSIKNHIQTIHASALFALAEAASGEALQLTFPEYNGKVVPVLRDSQIKFKKPATNSVMAYTEIDGDNISKFREQFEKKTRSSISVDVEIKDLEGALICSGTFTWFIQGIQYNDS